jgi:hypothetical protein
MVWDESVNLGLGHGLSWTSEECFVLVIVIRYYPAGNTIVRDASGEIISGYSNHVHKLKVKTDETSLDESNTNSENDNSVGDANLSQGSLSSHSFKNGYNFVTFVIVFSASVAIR